MLRLIRSGHKTLVMETTHPEKTVAFLKQHLPVIKSTSPCPSTSKQINEFLSHATERHVIVYLTKNLSGNLTFSQMTSILSIQSEIFEVLMALVNEDKNQLVSQTRVGPGMVIVKLIGDEKKIVEAVAKDFDVKSADFLSQLNENSSGTIIAFAKGDISKPVSATSFFPLSFHTQSNFRTVLETLRLRNLKYLNAGLHNEDWYELKIKIYDAYGNFDLHYRRLSFILEKLNLGLILGESWGTDAALIFLSVGVYKVRFFTFYTPTYIKQILIGLEFLEKDIRIVDYDLYHGRKKIHWDSIRTKSLKSRETLSSFYRKDILSCLSDEDKQTFFDFEKEIMHSQKDKFEKSDSEERGL